MQKTNFWRRAIIYVLASLVLDLVNFQPATAAFSVLTDVVSTSNPGVAATHRIQFTTETDIGDGGYYEVTFDDAFGDVSRAYCAGSVATTTDSVRCTYTTSPGAATTTVITVVGLANPLDSDSYIVDVDSYDAADAPLEAGQARVAIVPVVGTMAHVNASMTFSMPDTLDVSVVNGVTVTGSSTSTLLPFGTLSSAASSTLAQTISLSTNATGGFACTVEQETELVNGASQTINSFDNSPDGTGSTSPHTWQPPRAVIGQDHTYGHLGVTTDDPSLSELDFTGSKYVGLNGIAPREIAYHDGPSSGSVLGSGKAHIAYTIQISDLQESGEYGSKLVYICTGNF